MVEAQTFIVHTVRAVVTNGIVFFYCFTHVNVILVCVCIYKRRIENAGFFVFSSEAQLTVRENVENKQESFHKQTSPEPLSLLEILPGPFGSCKICRFYFSLHSLGETIVANE